MMLNIGRDTCIMEFSQIQGLSEHRRRELGVNLTGGSTNALEITEKIFGMPPVDQVLKDFCEKHGYPLPEELIGDDTVYVETDGTYVPLDEEAVDNAIPDW